MGGSVDGARLAPVEAGDLLLSRVVDRLREAILRGDFAPGDKLSVPDLARTLQTSRTPVREALYALERSGLVVMRPRRGAVVFGGGPTELRHLFEVREGLDGMAARLAAERMTEAERAALREVWQRHDAALAARDLAEHVTLDVRFHDLVRDGAHNPVLSESLARLRDQMTLIVRSWSGSPGALGRRTRADHRALAEAVLAGDAEHSEATAREHVRNVAAFVLRTELPGAAAPSASA
ncbi:GntR family transcriptional regulator [Pseudonocardia sp. NPDC049154]|uniref:GntR family transcriptional regulator n=1 Tax=Pseudonocardia sp. NPDC049154 TaxID=3155501 RepID=UPI0033C6155B